MRDVQSESENVVRGRFSHVLTSSAFFTASMIAILTGREPSAHANIPPAPAQKAPLLLHPQDDLSRDDSDDLALSYDLLEGGCDPDHPNAIPLLRALLDPAKNPHQSRAEAAARALARLSKNSPVAARVYARKCLMNPRFKLNDVIDWTELGAGAKHLGAVHIDALLRKAFRRGELRGEKLDVFTRALAAMRRLRRDVGDVEEIDFLMTTSLTEVKLQLNEEQKATVLPTDAAIHTMDFFLRRITSNGDGVLQSLRQYMDHGNYLQSAYAHAAFARIADRNAENAAFLSKSFDTDNRETASVLVDVCSQCPYWRKMLWQDILTNISRSFSQTQARAAAAMLNETKEPRVINMLRPYLPEPRMRKR